MRSKKNQKKVASFKRNSINSQQILILDEGGNREFFKFVNGSLQEYDRTRANGMAVKLSKEEVSAACEFSHS